MLEKIIMGFVAVVGFGMLLTGTGMLISGRTCLYQLTKGIICQEGEARFFLQMGPMLLVIGLVLFVAGVSHIHKLMRP